MSHSPEAVKKDNKRKEMETELSVRSDSGSADPVELMKLGMGFGTCLKDMGKTVTSNEENRDDVNVFLDAGIPTSTNQESEET